FPMLGTCPDNFLGHKAYSFRKCAILGVTNRNGHTLPGSPARSASLARAASRSARGGAPDPHGRRGCRWRGYETRRIANGAPVQTFIAAQRANLHPASVLDGYG